MQKIYCIPGLGADYRLYSRLNLNAELIPVKWITAEVDETPADYANRLLDQIKDDNPILMGVSLGAVLAVEISKLINCKKLYLISTVKTKKELPPYFSMIDYLPFRLSSATGWFKKHAGVLKPIYNKTNKSDLELFKKMLDECPTEFVDWGVNAVAHWQNESIDCAYLHIHGSMDLVFPKKWVKNFVEIKGGSHYMVVDKANQISPIINEDLGKITSK